MDVSCKAITRRHTNDDLTLTLFLLKKKTNGLALLRKTIFSALVVVFAYLYTSSRAIFLKNIFLFDKITPDPNILWSAKITYFAQSPEIIGIDVISSFVNPHFGGHKF